MKPTAAKNKRVEQGNSPASRISLSKPSLAKQSQDSHPLMIELTKLIARHAAREAALRTHNEGTDQPGY